MAPAAMAENGKGHVMILALGEAGSVTQGAEEATEVDAFQTPEAHAETAEQ